MVSGAGARLPAGFFEGKKPAEWVISFTVTCISALIAPNANSKVRSRAASSQESVLRPHLVLKATARARCPHELGPFQLRRNCRQMGVRPATDTHPTPLGSRVGKLHNSKNRTAARSLGVAPHSIAEIEICCPSSSIARDENLAAGSCTAKTFPRMRESRPVRRLTE